jgi:hypothetical protein
LRVRPEATHAEQLYPSLARKYWNKVENELAYITVALIAAVKCIIVLSVGVTKTIQTLIYHTGGAINTLWLT